MSYRPGLRYNHLSMGRRSLGVVVLAAGRGRRMGTSTPKPYLPLYGRPILVYSLEKFSRSPLVSEIVLVIHPDDRRLLREILAEHPYRGIKVVVGGERRQDSALAGVRAIRSEWVAVHDVVRPLFSLELLGRVFEAACSNRAAIPALPLQETIKAVGPEGYVVGEADRERLYLVQTPQCFERPLLEHSLKSAHKRRRYFTDEAGAVLAMGGVRPKVIPGEVQNIKITTPADLRWAERLLEAGLGED